MPRNGARFLLVTTKHLHLLAEVSQIEQLQQMVARRRHEPVAVVVPPEVHHGRFVGVPETET